MGKIAMDTGGIAANVYSVPNQRIKFIEDWDEKYVNKGRAEDQIIAYTWKRFIDTPNLGPQTDEPFWLLRFPMVKAAARNGRAIEYCASCSECIATYYRSDMATRLA